MSKEKSYPEQHRSIGALLRIPFQYLAQEVYGQLARSGHGEVRASHSVVFRYILPEGSRITELAERAGITKQSMAALVAHLEIHGYVRVEADPIDGRAKRVVLTKQGELVQREALRLSREVEKQWARLIGEKEMIRLRQLLEKLYDKLEVRV